VDLPSTRGRLGRGAGRGRENSVGGGDTRQPAEGRGPVKRGGGGGESLKGSISDIHTGTCNTIIDYICVAFFLAREHCMHANRVF
jgi:hypothetical protein